MAGGKKSVEPFVLNNQFKVIFGSDVYGFSRISNLSQSMEYDSIAEGGRNWSPLMFRKSSSRSEVMTLERGVRTVRNNNPAAGMRVGTLLKSVFILIRMDQISYRKYTFDEGVITKMKIADLNAMGAEVLIESLEITHSGLVEIKVSG